MTARKSISFPADLHAEWAALAAEEGIALAAWVTKAVETQRAGPFPLQPYQAEVLKRAMAPGEVLLARPRPRVTPKDCTNRVPKGTYCKVCGAAHR